MKNEFRFNDQRGLCYVTADHTGLYNYHDFLKITNYVHRLAKKLFDAVDGERPEDLHAEWLAKGMYNERDLKSIQTGVDQYASAGFVMEFRSPINMSHGSFGGQTQLATDALSRMEFFTEGGSPKPCGSGTITWQWGVGDEINGEEGIGLSWEYGQLVDYDGVEELPKEVRFLLDKVGLMYDDYDELFEDGAAEVKFIELPKQ